MKSSEDAGLPWQLPPSVWGKRHILLTHPEASLPSSSHWIPSSTWLLSFPCTRTFWTV